MKHLLALATLVAVVFVLVLNLGAEEDTRPLPSWNDGPAREAILSFVARVTKEGGPNFVPPAERIVVFDNDGTLWSEQPMYVQLAFVLDRIKALAPQHPEWKDQEPFKSVLAGDLKTALSGGKEAVVELVAATHAGMTTEAFDEAAREWIASARHPETNRPYTEMVYQPMLELLAYLRANGFQTWIVSGGGVAFMRPWTELTYGIPPHQVIGSRLAMTYEVGKDGVPRIVRQAKIGHIDDGPGKPVGIEQVIGRRPIAAFGNSDGDFQMLEWTTAGKGARLGALIHHDDAAREVAYDRKSHIGKLDRGLDEASKRGWVLVGMKDAWSCVYPKQD